MSIVLDQQSRNGSFSSGSILIPSGAQNITLLGTMNQTDAANVDLHCSGKIRVSFDGVTYKDDLAWAFEWQGGGPDPRHPGQFKVPSWGIGVPVDINQNPAVRVMGVLDTQGTTINMGLDLSAA